MKFEVLSSGSKGNTTFISTNETKILIDCGNTCKYVCEKLKSININPNELDAIFITHTHKDHISGLKVFLHKYNIKVYLTEKMLNDLPYVENYELINIDDIIIKDMKIEIIKTSHDAPDARGYIINGNNKSLVYITDTGYINNKYHSMLENRDAYIFESNHDVELLNNSSYPFALRKRILSDKGHLSNHDSSVYLSKFIGNNTKYILLAHLSEENNTPLLAYNTLIDKLKETNKEVDNIIIAKQNEETELITIW